jgi:predicted aldo/keto reductase-like oxidoreductase
MKNESRPMSRRTFVSGSLATLGAVSALGASGLGKTEALAPFQAAVPPASGLITRTLGRTGLKLPIVNMGVMNADNPDLVRKAYELGIRHFDTASSYWRGRNEEMVGRVVTELKARDKVVIATKVAIPPDQRRNLSPADLKAAFLKQFEGSLKRLQSDYVDILYIHDVIEPEDLGRPGFQEALLQAKKDGMARFIGFSTHRNMAALADEAVKQGIYDVILASFNYAFADWAGLGQSLRAAAEKGIGLIAMKTQCMQDWYKEELPAEVKARYGGTIVQTAALKWALRHEFIACAVPGFTNFTQLDEDMTVARDLAYTPQEEKFLADRQIKLAMTRCLQCGRCEPTCPRGADVPALMRAHMYLGYPNALQARLTLDGLAKDKGLQACGLCASCAAVCAGNVPVGRRVRDLREIFIG